MSEMSTSRINWTSAHGMLLRLAARLSERRVAVYLVTGLLVLLAAAGVLTWAVSAIFSIGFAALAIFIPGRRRSDAEGRIERKAARVVQFADLNRAGEIALWRQVLEAIPDASLLLDSNGVVMAANLLATELLPVANDLHIARLIRSPELLGAVDAALATGRAEVCGFRIHAPIERHMTGYASPVGAGDETQGRYLLVVLRDATDEHQLARLRADFVANASHELRTPLASLKGFIETLLGSAKDDPAARERFLGIMLEQANRMSRLIDDLLSLSTIEMREHVAPRGLVDLTQIAAEVLSYLAPLAEERGISLQMSLVSGDARVVGERDELSQVVQNLVQNAIKYGKDGGCVDVKIVRIDDRIELSVIDDGIGIAPQHLPRLTERFYRVSAKQSRERGGTGLGLAIVKHILNRHQSELRVKSELGSGSEFTVILPHESTRRVPF